MTTTSPDAQWGDFKAFQRRFPGLCSKTRAYEMLRAGQLRAKKCGGRTLWSFSAAEELIESLPPVFAE